MTSDPLRVARNKAAMAEYPVDIMYGPNNVASTRDFYRMCLSAREEP